MTDRHHRKAEELCELLPWYVNHTLDEAEMLAMEQHLRQCEECAEELDVLRAVKESVHNESVAVLPPKPNADQFLAAVENNHLRPPLHNRVWVTAAVAAGVALLVVAGLNWMAGYSSPAPVVYQTATSADSGATFDYVVLVSFDQGVDLQARSEALQALEPVSIAGPDPVGNYRLVIRLPAQSMDEIEEFRQQIESEPVISSVDIVAIELPVEAR